MTQEDDSRDTSIGAPGVQKESGILHFSEHAKRKRGGSAKGQNATAWKHGFYSQAFTAEEMEERQEFETQAIEDLGDDLPAGKRALLQIVSLQYAMIRRCDRAITSGIYIATEHLLALMNSFRLNVSALGLERKQKSGPNLQEYLRQKTQEGNK